MPIYAVVTAEVSGGTTAASRPIPTNIYADDFSLGLSITVECSAGDQNVSAAVQHTFDDIQRGASARWFNHSTLGALGQATAADGTYTEPVMAVRAVVTKGTVAGPKTKATLKLIQAGW